jgi:hypothetical protein
MKPWSMSLDAKTACDARCGQYGRLEADVPWPMGLT